MFWNEKVVELLMGLLAGLLAWLVIALTTPYLHAALLIS